MRLEATGAWMGIFVLVFVSVLAGPGNFAFAQLVKSVEAVGMTVADMDRSIEFFNKVLTLEKISAASISLKTSLRRAVYNLIWRRMRLCCALPRSAQN